MKRLIAIVLGIALITNLAACGTILHPERKGQVNGRLDVGIVVLDAIGLLFFFLPGVIAFAVDFSNGTIYLPKGKRASLTKEELNQITVEGKVNIEGLISLIQKGEGIEKTFSSKGLQVSLLNSVHQLPTILAVVPTTSRYRL